VELYQPPEYLVGSLIVAKAVILVDSFLNTGWFRGLPLIYATLCNTTIYSVAVLVVRHIELVFTLIGGDRFMEEFFGKRPSFRPSSEKDIREVA
jgi:hypothetical protein